MLTQILLPDGDNLMVEQVIFDEETIVLEISSSQPTILLYG